MTAPTTNANSSSEIDRHQIQQSTLQTTTISIITGEKWT